MFRWYSQPKVISAFSLIEPIKTIVHQNKWLLLGFVGLSLLTQTVKADLFLKVDFDLGTSGIQDIPVVVGGKTTAHIILLLDGSETLYDYKFSVRYDSSVLVLDGDPDDTPPAGFVETVTRETFETGAGGGFTNQYREIQNFDGNLPVGSKTAADIPDGLVVGTLKFNVLSTLDPGRLIIMPGDFYGGTNDLGKDQFLGDDGQIPKHRLGFFGNNGITAVPEPSSFVLLGVASISYFFRSRVSVSMERLRRLFGLS